MRRICKYCREEFGVYYSRKDTAKFCSKECKNKSQIGVRKVKYIKLICKHCKIKFEVKPMYKCKIFCSKKCHLVYVKKNMHRISLICLYCGNKFKIPPHLKNRKYCSKNCSYKGKIGNIRKRVKIKCVECGDAFSVMPCRKRKFCNKKCGYKNLSKARMGSGNPCFGKKYSLESRKRMSRDRKGRKMREETKKKIGKKNKISIKELWKNGDYKEKQLIAQRNGMEKRPTKPEKIMINLIKENNLPFNYVGDGSFWVRKNEGCFNPDFINIKEKLIIEVFGDYWHNREDSKKRDKQRLKTYKRRGFKTIIVWEHELEETIQVIDRIVNFIR